MQKWEYTTLIHILSGTTDNANFLGSSTGKLEVNGQNGWELVNVIYTGGSIVYFFKRPANVDEAPAGAKAYTAAQELLDLLRKEIKPKE
jgi:hypothetical protein